MTDKIVSRKKITREKMSHSGDIIRIIVNLYGKIKT